VRDREERERDGNEYERDCYEDDDGWQKQRWWRRRREGRKQRRWTRFDGDEGIGDEISGEGRVGAADIRGEVGCENARFESV